MAERKDRIRVHIEGQELSVVGGEFQQMLAAVKQINGRRFVSELKVWQLPGTIEEIRRQLEISGYQLEGGSPVATDETPAGPSSPARSTSDRVRIRVGEHRLAVVGGSFQEMLAAVKRLPGRRFDGETKMWEIPGDVAVIKGMIETAGFQLEGAENIPLGPVPAMEPPDFVSRTTPPPFEPPDFLDDDEVPPFEPPDWWDDMAPPPFEDFDSFDESIPLDYEPSPFETNLPAATPTRGPTSAGDRIRLRLGQIPLIISGGSFQELLTTVKNIPGRRFNAAEKVWEIPEEVTLESVQQAINAAGFVLTPE